MTEWTTSEGVRLYHPNRRKASSKATKAVVVLLILVSVALMLVVTIGGWEKLAGAKPLQIAYIVVYLTLAFFIARWTRAGAFRWAPRGLAEARRGMVAPSAVQRTLA